MGRDNRELLPLTAPQRGIWFAEALSPEFSVNIAHFVDIKHAVGGLDVDLLAECTDVVTKLMGAFRVRFTLVDGEPMQYEDPDYPPVATVIDFRDEDDPWASARAWMDEDYRRPVDVLNDQLVVAALLRISDERTVWYMRGHHLLCDGIAANTSMRRALKRYATIVAGREPDDRPAATLEEVVAYDAEYAGGELRAADREYWSSRITEMPEPVSLARGSATASLAAPTVHARRPLPPALQQRLEALAEETGSIPAALLTAAVAAFVARMTGSDDIVLSLPVTGRTTKEIQRSAGMLSNILPIRVRDIVDTSVRDLADTTKNELFGALDHQRYRSEDIRREAGLDARNLYFGPLINMMFFRDLVIEGAELDYEVLTTGIIEDLAVNLYQSVPGAPMSVDILANSSIYTRAEIEEHLDRLLLFTERLYADPDQSVADVGLLNPGEDTDIHRLETGPDLTVPVGGHVLEPFTRAAQTYADSTALLDDEGSWTYREVDHLRRDLAHRLMADGVRAGDRVAIALPRSVDQVIAIYAVWTIGAAYVPVDVEQPDARQRQILDASSPRLVVDADHLRRLGFSATAPVADPPPLPPAPTSAMPAYVLFTSGSTGTPKGVEVSHDAISRRMAWGHQRYPLTEEDVVMYKTPFTFDVSLPELVAPLQVGATMVVARADGHRDPDYLRETIADKAVTSVHFVPSMLDVFIATETAHGDPVMAPSVRRVIASGEALPATTAAQVVENTKAEMVNLYGPTEAAVEVTEYVVRPGDKTIPIGHPVPGMAARVLDGRLRRVPVGVAGELYLSGAQLAYGYFGATDRTSHRFVADPFTRAERMYRTGDVVRWNTEGNLEYLGRTDHQVKIRGQRVELGEIEAVLAGHDDVDSAVVVVHDEGAAPILVGYVKPAVGADVDGLPGRLVDECRRTLPSHMVPATVMPLEQFPTSSAGKLDRKALPEPDLDLLATEYVAPESAAELAVAEVLAEVLGLDRLGVTESFFDAGGDSLSAMRAVPRLGEILGANLTVRDLFAQPTVRGLVDSARELATSSTPLVKVDPRPDRIPVSEVQRGMWLLNRADPDSPVYNMPFAFQITGDLDLAALQRAVGDLLERQEALRTYYPMSDGDPVQAVSGVEEVLAQQVMDPRPITGSAVDAVAQVAAQGFDVTERAPFRFAVFSRGATDHVIVIVVHHINADGVSLWPLAADFMAAYAARARGDQPQWQPLGIAYADFALWQQDRLEQSADEETSERERQLGYWKERLAGAPPVLGLPTDRPRSLTPSFDGDVVGFEIPREVYAGIEEIGHRHQATPFMVVHAAYAALLGRLSGQQDVVVGIPYAGRSARDLDEVVGMFVNSLALRTELNPGERFVDLLERVREQDLQDMAHADVAFESVVDAVGARRRGGTNPVFQTMLWFQNIEIPEVNLDGLVVEPIDPGVNPAKVDLQLAVFPGNHPFEARADADGEVVRAEVNYSTALFDRPTIELLVQRLLRLLEAIVADPTSVVADLSIDAAEQDSPASAESVADDRPLPELVDLAGSAAPSAVAVDGHGAALSFGDLAGNAAAMAITLPDPDAALVTALFALLPDLAAAGPEALGDVLADLRTRAAEALRGPDGTSGA
ncbi:amino acid adenylation domain-containing protein [Gordonia sp. (in: high G+C Gram-positive bacteria)]|uniref:amino acid adenylation domain-containing protein n=1 Tax=Gordonia sp. (in: high G+C Gram-positive bacteria) TaxID=84139 RepID=UPI0039E3141C